MNFGSLLGAISSVLPGYIQGQRQAVQDNWRDLEEYNKTQQGQYANAFTAATWQPRLSMFYNSKYNSDFNTLGNFYNLMQKQAWQPYNMSMAGAFSQAAPYMAPEMVMQTMKAWQNVGKYGMFPGLGGLLNMAMGGGMGGMTTPSLPSNLGV